MNQGIAIILEEDKSDLIPDDSDAGCMLNEMITKMRDRKSTRLNSSHITRSRMPSSA